MAQRRQDHGFARQIVIWVQQYKNPQFRPGVFLIWRGAALLFARLHLAFLVSVCELGLGLQLAFANLGIGLRFLARLEARAGPDFFCPLWPVEIFITLTPSYSVTLSSSLVFIRDKGATEGIHVISAVRLPLAILQKHDADKGIIVTLSLFRHDPIAVCSMLHSKSAPPMALVAAARGFRTA